VKLHVRRASEAYKAILNVCVARIDALPGARIFCDANVMRQDIPHD
jgi:hypothetical protein